MPSPSVSPGQGDNVLHRLSRLAIASGFLFVLSSYVLLFSSDHKYTRSIPLSVAQMVAAGVLGVASVCLLAFTMVPFVVQESAPGTNAKVAGKGGAGSAKRRRTVEPVSYTVAIIEALALLLVGYFRLHAFLGGAVKNEWPKSRGLVWGIVWVILGQIFVISYHYVRSYHGHLLTPIQTKFSTPYSQNHFSGQVAIHFTRSELLLLLPYLVVTWMFAMLPSSYYDYAPNPSATNVILQFLCVDFFTYINHVAEHSLSELYRAAHKAHHKFTAPQLFNAFDATILDAVLLILLPLYATATLCHVHTWDYVVFGTMYSTYFMLIHSEYAHFFDGYFGKLGIYTAEDHQVHHALFNYNYSHFFTYWDRIFGTYRAGCTVDTFASYKKKE